MGSCLTKYKGRNAGDDFSCSSERTERRLEATCGSDARMVNGDWREGQFKGTSGKRGRRSEEGDCEKDSNFSGPKAQNSGNIFNHTFVSRATRMTANRGSQGEKIRSVEKERRKGVRGAGSAGMMRSRIIERSSTATLRTSGQG